MFASASLSASDKSTLFFRFFFSNITFIVIEHFTGYLRVIGIPDLDMGKLKTGVVLAGSDIVRRFFALIALTLEYLLIWGGVFLGYLGIGTKSFYDRTGQAGRRNS